MNKEKKQGLKNPQGKGQSSVEQIVISDCPFCGSGDTFCETPIMSTQYAVICDTCEAQGPIKVTEKEAISRWNFIIPR